MSLLLELAHGGWLRSIDHSLAKTMQRLRPETPDWVLAAAALASSALAQGHSQLPLARVGELLIETAGEREPPDLPALREWLAQLQASPWLQDGVLVLQGDAVALTRYWRYEQRLSAAVRSRLSTAPMPTDIFLQSRLEALFPAGDGAQEQAAAARATLEQRFVLLTGGPGTGKTSTVARALVLFAEQHAARHDGQFPRILLAAPTGKAATRLAESVRENLQALRAAGTLDSDVSAALPAEAQTLHRMLGWRRGSVDFLHDADFPLPADLVVVDEASMIDLPLMCKLLDAVPRDATLLLIGDRDQLPSVETGDVLAALCDAGLPQRVHLEYSHRQGTGVDVAQLAALVRDGEAAAAVAGLESDSFRGVHWRQGSDRALAEAVLAQALPAYRAMQAAADVASALATARQFRVLTALREGAAGSQTLNTLIATALDPQRRGDGFFAGRLVLVVQNSYRHQLFNGDIGIAWPDADGELRVWFDAAGGPRAWLPAALPAHESAFALTVHKSQGSEFERVLLALPELGARVISRELLYTGLTRCRSEVTVWCSEPVLREAIARKAQRWSGLSALLGPVAPG